MNQNWTQKDWEEYLENVYKQELENKILGKSCLWTMAIWSVIGIISLLTKFYFPFIIVMLAAYPIILFIISTYTYMNNKMKM